MPVEATPETFGTLVAEGDVLVDFSGRDVNRVSR